MGGGKVGEPLASSLINAGHEVFILDDDHETVTALQRELGMVAALGDATSIRDLSEAGASRADVLIATTNFDEDNLAACQLARNHFDIQRTIAVVNSPENAELFERSGIDMVVNATGLILANLATIIPSHPLIRLMPIGDHAKELVAIKLPAGGLLIGRKLSEITLPYGTDVISIITSDGKSKKLDPDIRIESEDEIIALSPTNSTAELWVLLTELR